MNDSERNVTWRGQAINGFCDVSLIPGENTFTPCTFCPALDFSSMSATTSFLNEASSAMNLYWKIYLVVSKATSSKKNKVMVPSCGQATLFKKKQQCLPSICNFLKNCSQCYCDIVRPKWRTQQCHQQVATGRLSYRKAEMWTCMNILWLKNMLWISPFHLIPEKYECMLPFCLQQLLQTIAEP